MSEGKPEIKLIELNGEVIPLTGIAFVQKRDTWDEEEIVVRRNWLRRPVETKTEKSEDFDLYVRWLPNQPFKDITMTWTTSAERDAAYDKLITALDAAGVLTK